MNKMDLRALSGLYVIHFVYTIGSVIIADFECSMEVVGMRFWRAPKIMLGLKKREVIKEEK